jgi:flagellar protein FliO/FliZ
MELVDFTRFIFALGTVIGLIWLAAHLFRRFGLDKKLRVTRSVQGKIEVVDMLFLDARRKLVVVRYDTKDYVLLLSGEGAIQLTAHGVPHGV